MTKQTVLPPGLLLVAFWMVTLYSEGLYDPLRMINSVRIIRALTRAAMGVLVLAIIVQFMSSNRVYSRFLLFSYIGIGWGILILWRVLFLKLQPHLLPPHATKARNILVIGVGVDAKLLSERIDRYGAHLYRCAGFLDTCEEETPAANPVLGSLKDLRSVVNEHDIKVIILSSRKLDRDQAYHITNLAGQMGLRVLQVPFTWGLASAKVVPAAIGEMELIQLGSLSYPNAAKQIKRAFDLTAVMLGGIVILPLIFLLAVAVKLQDGGPIIYSSPRLGKGGRIFPFFKFRSMVVGADKLRAELDAQNESDGRLFKMSNDPRITPLGAFMRKFSVDELPQLLNVLRGEMNLIGPRPLPASDLEGIEDDVQYAYWFQQRSQVKPGITGLWQVAGRSDLGFSAMVDLDVHYVQNWSLFLDLQILVKTIPAVLKGRGAT